MLNGERVFLVGGNLPWINYAYDFGNNQWAGVKSRVEDEMKLLRDAGGNTMSKSTFDLTSSVSWIKRNAEYLYSNLFLLKI